MLFKIEIDKKTKLKWKQFWCNHDFIYIQKTETKTLEIPVEDSISVVRVTINPIKVFVCKKCGRLEASF